MSNFSPGLTEKVENLDSFSTKILLDISKNLPTYLGSEPCWNCNMLFIGDKQNESMYSTQSYFSIERGKRGLLRSLLALQLFDLKNRTFSLHTFDVKHNFQ